MRFFVGALALAVLISGCANKPEAEVTDPVDNPFLRAHRLDQIQTALNSEFPIGTQFSEINEWMRVRGSICESFDPNFPFVRCRYSINRVLFDQRWIIDVYLDRNQGFRYLTVRQALAP